MIMYAQIKGQSMGERVILSYNIEKELERNKMSIDDYLKETLMLNPDFERVYCRWLIYGVPILGLASYISLLLYEYLWYHIRGVFVYIG